MRRALLLLLTAATPAFATPADDITPRTFPLPPVTEWRPTGCRSVPVEHPALLPETAFRRAHSNLASSDEVALAFPPVIERKWVAETSLYQVTTPSFDSDGNIYMTPLLPHEPILMLSLDAETGARRFIVPLEEGQRGGASVPLVLRDPEGASDVIYINSYSRVIAVRADGSPVWDVETGLGVATTPAQSPIGLAWVPNADAIVGQTRDGFVFLLDRRRGSTVVPPYQLPGERTRPMESEIPPAIAAMVDELLAPLLVFSSSGGVLDLINVLLGGDSEVANNLSVDARSNRLWIAATAPDGEDGVVDGVSDLGALYRFDVVSDGDGWTLDEVCHHSFSGGSASTPSLGAEGARVYLGDGFGALIAIDAEDCNVAWEVDLNSQIFGSVAVSSDGREIYAASASGIFQVFDDGDRGRRGWTAALDLYDVPDDLVDYGGMNLLLTGVGANGLLVQAGAGLLRETQNLPVRTGIAHVDRLTGEARWFADGLEESLAAMSTGEDGSLYLSHSPLRRAFSLALGLTDEPLLGGISKWGPARHDLLMRDAACTAAERGSNAAANGAMCPGSARADGVQMQQLIAQIRNAGAPQALAKGELDEAVWRRVDRSVARAESSLVDFLEDASIDDLERATQALHDACDLLVDPSQVAPAGEDDDGCQICVAPSLDGTPLLVLFVVAILARAAGCQRPVEKQAP